jgi:DNA-binding PadR family transcriptional regulator
LVGVASGDVERFREKLDRELKAGLISILLLLAIDRKGPEYGYRLLKTLHAASGGRFAFKEGTAYPLLQNLERAGLVTTFWGEGDSGPPRKYYQTTALGKGVLEGALHDWRALVADVDALVGALEKEETT